MTQSPLIHWEITELNYRSHKNVPTAIYQWFTAHLSVSVFTQTTNSLPALSLVHRHSALGNHRVHEGDDEGEVQRS